MSKVWLFGLIIFEMTVIAIAAFSQPNGYEWLGNTIQNTSDQAVYLNYIKQGSPLLTNLYAVESHRPRIDAFWSLLSLVHRVTAISPILIHEIARVLVTILLAISLYASARTISRNDGETRLATFLAITGVGLGWVYIVLIEAHLLPQPGYYLIPDFSSEFAVAPSLLGGAHIILSIAILTYVMRMIWNREAKTLPTAGAILALTLFHPYFTALIGLAVLAESAIRFIRTKKRPPLRRPLIFLLSLLPALLYYLPFYLDPVFNEHQTETNALPLAPILSWVFVLTPVLLALIWMHRRKLVRDHFRQVEWCIAWIVLATALALFAPVPWSRKFLEGLMIPLVFITIPAWSALALWMRRVSVWVGFFYIAACLAPFSLIASQIQWNHRDDPMQFSQHSDVFTTWDYLDQADTNAVILADNDITNLWTPAWTGKHVWYGHPHETPSYEIKVTHAKSLFESTDTEKIRSLLDAAHITHLIVTRDNTRAWVAHLPKEWSIVVDLPHAILLERSR